MGYGVDADQKLVPNFQRGLTGNGGLFTLWINYVFLVCALWWVFTISMVNDKDTPFISLFIWFLAVFIIKQIVWLVLIISYCFNTIQIRCTQ